MSDRIKCAACGSHLSRSPESNVSRFRCPKCKAILRVSGFDESTTIVERPSTPTESQPGERKVVGSRLSASDSASEMSKSATSVDPGYPPPIANPPSPTPRRFISGLIGFTTGVAMCAIILALMINQGIVSVGGQQAQGVGKAPIQLAKGQPEVPADQLQGVPGAEAKQKPQVEAPAKPKPVSPFAFGSPKIKSATWDYESRILGRLTEGDTSGFEFTIEIENPTSKAISAIGIEIASQKTNRTVAEFTTEWKGNIPGGIEARSVEKMVAWVSKGDFHLAYMEDLPQDEELRLAIKWILFSDQEQAVLCPKPLSFITSTVKDPARRRLNPEGYSNPIEALGAELGIGR